jgi:hypothetical protein
MKLDENKLFDNLGGTDVSLFERIKNYANELDIGSPLTSLFEEDTPSFTASTVVDETSRLMNSTGHLLSIVQQKKSRYEFKLDRIFHDEYISVTDSLLAPGARGSSKYDVNYRTGKALQAEKHKVYSDLIREISVMEKRLISFKESLQLRSMVLPTILKLDKQNHY